MAQGIIKAIVADRGFGFISRPGDSDLFFHIRETQLGNLDFDECLRELPVEFDVEVNELNGKLQAVNVRVVK